LSLSIPIQCQCALISLRSSPMSIQFVPIYSCALCLYGLFAAEKSIGRAKGSFESSGNYWLPSRGKQRVTIILPRTLYISLSRPFEASTPRSLVTRGPSKTKGARGGERKRKQRRNIPGAEHVAFAVGGGARTRERFIAARRQGVIIRITPSTL
jgi:hypothetical protein